MFLFHSYRIEKESTSKLGTVVFKIHINLLDLKLLLLWEPKLKCIFPPLTVGLDGLHPFSSNKESSTLTEMFLVSESRVPMFEAKPPLLNASFLMNMHLEKLYGYQSNLFQEEQQHLLLSHTP